MSAAIVQNHSEISFTPRESLRQRPRAKASLLKRLYRRVTDLGERPTDPRLLRYALMFGVPLLGSAAVLYGI